MSSARKILAVMCLSLLAAACNPKQQTGQQQGANAAANSGEVESGRGLRAACASEIQNLCANDQHKRHCLRENMNSWGAPAKPQSTRHWRAAAGIHGGIGRICADDMQKFCANDPRKMHCLKQNLAQLSDACKAAVNAPREPQQGTAQPTNGNP